MWPSLAGLPPRALVASQKSRQMVSSVSATIHGSSNSCCTEMVAAGTWLVYGQIVQEGTSQSASGIRTCVHSPAAAPRIIGARP